MWTYNKVNDISGQGAVATFYGVPTRMAKLGNFLAGYGTERLGIWGISQWLAQGIGVEFGVVGLLRDGCLKAFDEFVEIGGVNTSLADEVGDESVGHLYARGITDGVVGIL